MNSIVLFASENTKISNIGRYKKEIEENDYSAQSEIGKWTIQSTFFMEKNKNRHYSIILSHTHLSNAQEEKRQDLEKV